MRLGAPTRAADLNAVFAAALEAAADRVSRRATDVIATARLATAVHMRQAAELTVARQGFLLAPEDRLAGSEKALPVGADSAAFGGGR